MHAKRENYYSLFEIRIRVDYLMRETKRNEREALLREKVEFVTSVEFILR